MANVRHLSLLSPTKLAGSSLTFSNTTFVNTTDQIEWIFQVPDDAGAGTVTITRLGYRLASVTGTSPVLQISLQGVTAGGIPDGTIKSSGNASATFTPAGSATWNWVNLTASYTANRGDWLAIVIAYSSGTLNGSNTPTISRCINVFADTLPISVNNVAGARTRDARVFPIYGFGSAGKAFGNPLQNLGSTLLVNPVEHALRFVIDATTCTTFKVVGLRFMGSTPAANKVCSAVLYSGTTALQTVTWGGNYGGMIGGVAPSELWFQDASLTTLVAGQEYRLSILPTDASNNVVLYDLQYAAQADMEALPGGQNLYQSNRNTGGATAWSDVTTSRPMLELILGDLTPPLPFMANRGLSGGLVG